MASSERVCYDTELVAMATSLEELEKNGPDRQHSHKYLPFGENIVKIGPVDPEIAFLNLKKKKEITEGKIYIPVGRFAERAKLQRKVYSDVDETTASGRLFLTWDAATVKIRLSTVDSSMVARLSGWYLLTAELADRSATATISPKYSAA